MDINTLLQLKEMYIARRGTIDIQVAEQKVNIEAAVTTYSKADYTIRLLEAETESKTLGFAISTINEQISRQMFRDGLR